MVKVIGFDVFDGIPMIGVSLGMSDAMALPAPPGIVRLEYYDRRGTLINVRRLCFGNPRCDGGNLPMVAQ